MITETKYYDIFKGISQHDRFKEELQPEFVKIDGRSVSDLLQFIRIYAEEINFFDTKKHKDKTKHASNWSPFFNRDNLILLIAVSNYDINEVESSAHALMDRALTTHDTALKNAKFISLFHLILSIGTTINQLKKQINRDSLTADLLFEIGNAIQEKLNTEITTLYNYKSSLNWESELEELFIELQKDWGWKSPKQKQDAFKLERQHHIEIKEAFNSFFYTAHFVIEKASKLLKTLLNDLKNNKPHNALYLAFLKLFKYAQDIQNELPKKHLNFYYRNVLRQKEKSAIPDQAFVSLNLAPEQTQFRLPKNTSFSGGKDESNNEIIYNSTRQVNLTDCKIAEICSLFKSTDNRCRQKPYDNFVTSFYSFRAARKKKGYFTLNSRPLFGEEQFSRKEEEKTMEEARLGFLIASPELNLKTGKRRVEFELHFDTLSFEKSRDILIKVSEHNKASFDETVYLVFSTAFEIQYSSEKGIQKLKNYNFNINFVNKAWLFGFELDIDDAPLTPFSGKNPDAPDCVHPFIQVFLKYECSLFLYSIIAELNLKNILITTKVKQITDFVLQNNLGPINPNQPFELFGTIPQPNNYFLIGHTEIFSKNINTLKLKLSWYSFPIEYGGMESYFAEYMTKALEARSLEKITTKDYKITPSYLVDGAWMKNLEEKETFRLFENKIKKSIALENEYNSEIEFPIDLSTLGYQAADLDKNTIYTQQSNTGFLRFDLDCPSFAFGHSYYAPLLSEIVLKNATRKRKDPVYTQPKLPFSPIVDHIELSYASSIKAISESPVKGKKVIVDFYHLNPFGYREIKLKSQNQFIPLMHTDDAQGSLFFGFTHYPKGGEISLLFEFDDEVLTKRKRSSVSIQWWYLKNNEWFPFKINSILNNSTNGFINSGIIELKIPTDIKSGNTIMNKDLLWIKGTIKSGALQLGKVSHIVENGIHLIHEKTERIDRKKVTLAPFTITKTSKQINEIGEVIQPMSSFGGKLQETTAHFYQRVSERLRHKNRAINALDYEELVLEKFPHIYKVKCFMASHSLNPKYLYDKTKVHPGSVIIAVAPDTSLIENQFCPRVTTQTLDNVKKFLDQYTSPFVNVTVYNPFYEQLRVICKVKFIPDESASFYEHQLQEHIIGYLNPWLTSMEVEEEFGKSIFKSDIMGFIQKLNYVAFVTEFSLVKIVENRDTYHLLDTARVSGKSHAQEIAKGEEIKTEYPWSILVSAEKHDIRVIDDPTYESPKPRGIKNMSLGTDFILSN